MNPQPIEIASLVEGRQVSIKDRGRSGAGRQTTAERGFVQLLDKALGRGQKAGLPWIKEISKGVRSKGEWLESFKNELLSSGVALQDMTLSRKAFHGLKKLLLADGFSEEDVKRLLDGLFGNNATREIKISELLQKISELKEKSKDNPTDFVLEASALPHLETLLRSFGLGAHQVEGMINDARVDGGRLSLKVLAQKLKTIAGDSPKGVGTDTSHLSVAAAKEMLTRIGMVEEANKLNGPVALERFVQLVEDRVARLAPHRLSDAQGKEHVAGLLENVSVASQDKDQKDGVLSRQGLALRGFPFQDLEPKNNEKQGNEGGRDGWRAAVSKVKQAPWGNKTGSETKGEIDTDAFDIKKSTQLTANGNDLSAKVEKLIEAVTQKPTKGGTDNNKLTAPPGVHDSAPDRMSGTENATKPATRPIPLYVVNQVGRRLGLALRRGENHVRLQLRPPHLGSIELNLAMKDNGLKIAMVAENQFIKDLMISHVNELREALVQQGVELQKIDVEINQNFGQSMANAEREFHRAHPWARSMASSPGDSDDETIGAHTIARPAHSDTMLDMFA
jgi:hypothetical protein